MPQPTSYVPWHKTAGICSQVKSRYIFRGSHSRTVHCLLAVQILSPIHLLQLSFFPQPSILSERPGHGRNDFTSISVFLFGEIMPIICCNSLPKVLDVPPFYILLLHYLRRPQGENRKTVVNCKKVAVDLYPITGMSLCLVLDE